MTFADLVFAVAVTFCCFAWAPGGLGAGVPGASPSSGAAATPRPSSQTQWELYEAGEMDCGNAETPLSYLFDSEAPTQISREGLPA